MTKIDQGDDSSVESACIFENGDEPVLCLDDISIESFTVFDLPRYGSVESLFSQTSFEIDLTPQSAGDERKQYDRRIMVSNVPDSIVRMSDVPSCLLGRDNSLSGSCSSILDQLHFGSISEVADYKSVASSDESSSEEGSDMEEKSLPRKRKSKTYRTRPALAQQHHGSRDDSSDTESSVDDNILKTILLKTDSSEQMLGSNRVVRTVRYSRKTKQGTRKMNQVVTSDPLLNLFLGNRRRQTALKPTGESRQASHLGWLEEHFDVNTKEKKRDVVPDSTL